MHVSTLSYGTVKIYRAYTKFCVNTIEGPLEGVRSLIGTVLHTAHGNTCQIHFDERFLYTALPAAIPLDDGSLEGRALEPRHMERDVAGSRAKVAVIVPAAVALTGLAALVAGGLRQRLRLLLQQFVQGFLYAAANQFLDLALDYFLV